MTKEKRAQLTVLILENRQMIATILADLLSGAGYQARLVADLDEVEELLDQCQPGLLLADRGMLQPEDLPRWEQVEKLAHSLGVWVLAFSCSAIPDGDEHTLILRSPGDFATVIDRIESEWRQRQPFLGMTLVEKGLLNAAELETALRVQHDLAKVGRHYPLGELLVRLDMIAAEDVEQALAEYES